MGYITREFGENTQNWWFLKKGMIWKIFKDKGIL